jgi:hypothetical protein
MLSPTIFVCEAGWDENVVGGVHTVSRADADVSGTPQFPVTMHRYFLPLMVDSAVKESVGVVPPVATFAQALMLSCHWYNSVPVPLPDTENVACVPAVAFWSVGFVKDAGVQPEIVTMFEFSAPQPLVMLHRNLAPVSAAVTRKAQVAEVAPVPSVALVQELPSGLRCHCKEALDTCAPMTTVNFALSPTCLLGSETGCVVIEGDVHTDIVAAEEKTGELPQLLVLDTLHRNFQPSCPDAGVKLYVGFVAAAISVHPLPPSVLLCH